MESIFRFSPAVFAVGTEYQIFVPVNTGCVMWVRVGDNCYYDHSNGVLRSDTLLHKITVPQCELDAARRYTVCYRIMIERKPYFSETSEICETEFGFDPLPDGRFTAYHIADAHGMVDAPCAAAESFAHEWGGIDMLILNGDVINHSNKLEYFDTFLAIAEKITHGTKPIIFSRGNHDTRGIYAEKIADYSPTRGGFSYFTFRLGSLWGIVLDCGEDKPDTNEEYGGTNCCHAFRLDETAYLEEIASRANEEYAREGITHRVVIAHMPFTMKFSPPFNIEEDLYGHWTHLIGERIRPDALISGHTHKLSITRPGGERDAYGQSFPTVVASEPDTKGGKFIGGGFIFEKNGIRVVFTDENGTVAEHRIGE